MINIKRNLVRLLDRAIMWGDFTLFLPLLARLPLHLGYLLAAWRGRFNWAFDREWRSISLGQRYIRAATNQSMKQLLPNLSAAGIRGMTRRRFEVYSREEFEAHLLIRDRVQELRFSFHGLENVRKQLAQGRGLVLLTPHFDSFILGTVCLGMTGLAVNIMTSNVVENPLVDECVRRFFFRKYRSMERYMQNGKAVHVEQNLRFFFQALRSGECVVVLADLPAPSEEENGIWVQFLGCERSFLSGAFRLARRTESALAGYICRWDGMNNYTVTFSECVPPEEVSEASYRRIYAFLEAAIQSDPARWCAADLLRTFRTR